LVTAIKQVDGEPTNSLLRLVIKCITQHVTHHIIGYDANDALYLAAIIITVVGGAGVVTHEAARPTARVALDDLSGTISVSTHTSHTPTLTTTVTTPTLTVMRSPFSNESSSSPEPTKSARAVCDVCDHNKHAAQSGMSPVPTRTATKRTTKYTLRAYAFATACASIDGDALPDSLALRRFDALDGIEAGEREAGELAGAAGECTGESESTAVMLQARAINDTRTMFTHARMTYLRLEWRSATSSSCDVTALSSTSDIRGGEWCKEGERSCVACSERENMTHTVNSRNTTHTRLFVAVSQRHAIRLHQQPSATCRHTRSARTITGDGIAFASLPRDFSRFPLFVPPSSPVSSSASSARLSLSLSVRDDGLPAESLDSRRDGRVLLSTASRADLLLPSAAFATAPTSACVRVPALASCARASPEAVPRRCCARLFF
jgi:hypothetical protein